MQLGLGAFYGLRRIALGNPAFDFRLMAASQSEHDVQLHSHETAHCVLVLAGSYISIARGASADLPAPTLIFNPAGTVHRDRFRNGRGLFLAVSVCAAHQARARLPIRQCPDPVRLCAPSGFAAAFRIVREMHGARDADVCESFAWELLGTSGQLLGEDTGRAARQAYELIMDRAVDAALGVRDVADLVDRHPVHLARMFRRRWGCAPAELIRWRRLDIAAKLLRRDRESLAQVALQSGFVDQSHMTRAFTASYGLTPVHFRRLHVSRIQDQPAGRS